LPKNAILTKITAVKIKILTEKDYNIVFQENFLPKTGENRRQH
jgi:hypothetical protein